MQVQTLVHHSVSPTTTHLKLLSQSLTSLNKSSFRFQPSLLPSKLCILTPKHSHNRFITPCIGSSQELVDDNEELASESGGNNSFVSLSKEEEEEEAVEAKTDGLANQSLWNQIKEIMMFTGPATGIWISGPLMSLIDTAVIGQGSSLELAALGTSSRFSLDLKFSV